MKAYMFSLMEKVTIPENKHVPRLDDNEEIQSKEYLISTSLQT